MWFTAVLSGLSSLSDLAKKSGTGSAVAAGSLAACQGAVNTALNDVSTLMKQRRVLLAAVPIAFGFGFLLGRRSA